MRIHVKLIGFVVTVLLIPLLLGIVSIHHFGKAYYRKQQGILYLTIAEELADTLQSGIQREFKHLSNWVEISPIADLIEDIPLTAPEMDRISRLDTAWPQLTEQDPRIQAILSNPLSDYLRVFNSINQWFPEIIVTDRHGRLIGATNKTTDYWQADETWWKTASTFPIGKEFLAGIVYDESANVLGIDISIPVYNKNSPREFAGVLKTSLNAAYLLQQTAPSPWNKEISRSIYFPDGSLLAHVNGQTMPKMPKLLPSTLQELKNSQKQWTIIDVAPGTRILAVAVPIQLKPEDNTFIETEDGTHELIVVVFQNLKDAMLPVQNTLRQMTSFGTICALLFILLSYFTATNWFAKPLRKLSRAALSIVEHIKRSEQGRFEDMWESRQIATEKLADLEMIRTKDELQELSTDFIRMGQRVLNFQRQLEQELTEKTEEIHSDLVMAREFQAALLPQDVPDVSAPEGTSLYNLHFSHVYRPALSVSGDFFDISKISEHCVRIFIADVMGHGARSALMTAILHALLHSMEKNPRNPSRLLQQMNDEFFAIGTKTNETVFVTAVHLIIDTATGIIRYSSAGHPPPLLLNQETETIDFLKPPENPPAVGLIQDFTYEDFTMTITGEQTLLLYTDGATEAMNPNREEFGEPRLIETVLRACRESKLDNLPNYILENLETFMDTAPTLDDICLISANLTRTKATPQTESTPAD